MNSIGISSSCFYPLPTELSFEKICRSGVKTAEIFYNSSSELSPDFTSKLLEMKNEFGVNVVSVHTYTGFMDSFNLFTDYERRFYDGLEIYRRLAEIAAAFGAGNVIMHGAKTYRTAPDDVMGERFRILADAVASEGARLCYENVNDYRSSDPSFLRFMMDCAQGKAGAVLDIKQARRAGVPWQDFVSALGTYIRHIHVSDFDDRHDCITPLEGQYDFEGLFRTMNELHYDGAYIIELYRQSYKKEEDIFKSANLLVEKLKKL